MSFPHYGLTEQARTLNGIDLDDLKYKKLDGKNLISPKGDLSGQEFKEA